MSEYDVVNPASYYPHYWVYEAENGARGSFSYVDNAKHGQRDYKLPSGVILTPWSGYQNASFPIIPGGGGGARPTPLAKHGSYSPGYSPHGVVIVRVFKVS